MSDRGRARSNSRDRNDRGDSRGDSRADRSDRDDKVSSRDGPEATTSLLVRNLSYRVRADEIRRIFVRYGDIRDVYIPQDYHTQRPRGFAFVEFYDRRDAADALDHLDRYEMDGREIAVVFAKDRRKTADEMKPRGGGRDSRNRGRRGGDRERGGRRDSRDRSRSRDRGDRGRGRDRDADAGDRRDRRSRSRSRSQGRRSPSPAREARDASTTSPEAGSNDAAAAPRDDDARRSRSRSASR